MSRWSLPGEYGGIRFRSHTEARWAIFWDELDVKWEYEPQGYATDGSAYLPDFVVFPALGMLWVEIKHNWNADPEGEAKWRKFTTQRPQPSRAALFAGLPTVHAAPVLIGGDEDASEPVKGPWEVDDHEWRPCPSGHHFDLGYPGTFGAKFAEDECPDDFGGNGEQRIVNASAKALAYRFGKNNPEPGR